MFEVNSAVKVIASCLLPGGFDKFYPGLNQSQVSLFSSHVLTTGKEKYQIYADLLLLCSYIHLTCFDPQKLKKLRHTCELQNCF